MTKSYYSTSAIADEVLPHASDDELLALTRVFEETATSPKAPKALAAQMCTAGGHSVVNWIRSQGVPYSELLFDVATTLKVPDLQPLNKLTSNGLSIAEMDERALEPAISAEVSRTWHWPLDTYMLHHEQAIVRKFIGDSYERMTPEQKAQIDKKVREIAATLPGSGMAGLSASAAVLALANVGGFATYMLMSTVISTLTLGVASFGVYTAAASVIHVILGPAGWAALGISAAYKLGGPNKQQCVKAVLAVAVLRSRLDHALLST